jgi:transcriptional regulator with XRE-family HTH domain
MSDFAARLKELREAAGLTQRELAERAGLHHFAIAKLEQGLREPAWKTVQAIAAALGVNCHAFEKKSIRKSRKPGPGRPPKK